MNEHPHDRRTFLRRLTHRSGAVFAVVFGAPVVAYVLDPRIGPAPRKTFAPWTAFASASCPSASRSKASFATSAGTPGRCIPNDVIGRVWVIKKPDGSLTCSRPCAHTWAARSTPRGRPTSRREDPSRSRLPARQEVRSSNMLDEAEDRAEATEQDLLLLPLARHLCRHQHQRHAERGAGGARSGRQMSCTPPPARCTARAGCADHRRAPAAGPVALFGHQDRRRSDGAVVQRSFGTPVAVMRPFNTYGPRQSARAVIPTIITQIAAGPAQHQARQHSPDPRFQLRRRHGAGLHRARSRPRPASAK